jgi:hypothetical protein
MKRAGKRVAQLDNARERDQPAFRAMGFAFNRPQG